MPTRHCRGTPVGTVSYGISNVTSNGNLPADTSAYIDTPADI
jgi:hypothetical protein